MRVTGSNPLSAVDRVGHAGPGSDIVDRIIEAESLPIQSAKQRLSESSAKKSEFQNLSKLLSTLANTADGMKNPSGFRKLLAESSHPDILEASVGDYAEVGSYEVEVEGLARSERHLAIGFPDKDKTPVGFGHMRVSLGDHGEDLDLAPGSTLQDVVTKINDRAMGVRASIINTGDGSDPFKLLVSSGHTGEAAQIHIDPDTTFLELGTQIKGQDLNAKFEGVDIKRSENALNDLIGGVNLKAMKAAPGTNVTVNVRPDVDRTADGVRDFVKNYNEIQNFSRKQATVDSATGSAGALSGDGAVRQVSRSLQNAMGSASMGSVGITTNPKTGELQIDETKLKDALTKDYQGVSNIFASTEQGPGLAEKLSSAIKGLQDRSTGAVATRIKGLDQRIKTQDQNIARKEERLSTKRAQLERTFASLDSKMASMNLQGQALNSRFKDNDPKEAAV